MEVIKEYNVGIVKVKVVLTNDGNYQYIISEPFGGGIEKKLRIDVDKILEALQPSKNSFYEVVKVVKKVLGKTDEEAVKIAYAIRKELRYKKLQVLIEDPFVEDITIVGPGPVWVRHRVVSSMDPNADYIKSNIVIEDENELLRYINLLAEKAGKVITKSSPILDANLPEEDGGHRIHLVLPDIAGSTGEIVVRKKKPLSRLGIKKLIGWGMINEAIVGFIKEVIKNRGSLIIVGPPGSGKTTLLRAIIYDLIPKSWKIAIIEDTPEIDPPPGSSWVRYIVPVNPWGINSEIDQMTLAKAALRASVSRFIVIGETRGSEAKVLTQAMNMGLGGLTTFHGGNAKEAMVRLMSPPINLAPSHIGMFWAFITVNYVVNGGIKRAVVSIDEPIYSYEDDDIFLNNIYSYGEEITTEELIKRCSRFRTIAEPVIAKEVLNKSA